MTGQPLASAQLLVVLEQSSGAVLPDPDRVPLAAARPVPQAARQNTNLARTRTQRQERSNLTATRNCLVSAAACTQAR